MLHGQSRPLFSYMAGLCMDLFDLNFLCWFLFGSLLLFFLECCTFRIHSCLPFRIFLIRSQNSVIFWILVDIGSQNKSFASGVHYFLAKAKILFFLMMIPLPFISLGIPFEVLASH